MSREEVAAGVVVFRPDPALLAALMETLRDETSAAFVFCNGPLESHLAEVLSAANVEIISSAHNLGVAEALNMLVLAARLAGFRRVILFDQDSQPPRDMVGRLDAVMEAAIAAGARPVVVGPRILSPAGSDFKPPRYFPVGGKPAVRGASAVRYVITSGSLIDLDAFFAIGRFRSDFFIDAIDTEWCFRAWARGFSCWVADDVPMQHRIGQGVVRVLGPGFPRQAEFRLYSYVRNQMYCLTLPHIPLGWKLRFFAHVARVMLASWIERKGSLRFLGGMLEAAQRGLAGKLGPPPGASGACTL